MATNGSGRNGAKGGGLNVVGKPYRKVDSVSKVTGVTKYADDIALPRRRRIRPSAPMFWSRVGMESAD